MNKGLDAIYSYLANNVGVFFIILLVVVIIAIYISKAFIKLNKNKLDNVLCQIHDSAIKSTSDSIRVLHDKVDAMLNDIRKITKSVAILSNDNISSTLWAKAEPILRYLKDETLRMVVLYKIRSFIEFADKASRDIDAKLGEEVIFTSMRLGADDVSRYILEKCGTEFHSEFMAVHEVRMAEYRSNVKKIINDPVNNHKQRFLDLSISFMNEFLSEMINAWMLVRHKSTPSIIDDTDALDIERINKQYEESADNTLF